MHASGLRKPQAVGYLPNAVHHMQPARSITCDQLLLQHLGSWCLLEKPRTIPSWMALHVPRQSLYMARVTNPCQ